jgi:acylphosphatase
MQAELKIIFKGKVQGVFFRGYLKQEAEKLDLKGFTKNLKDGSVEVRAIGEIKILKHFVENILKNPGNAKIDFIDSTFLKEVSNYKKFIILSDFRDHG